MFEILWKYGWLIVTLAITLLFLAYSRVPQTLVDVIYTILVVPGIGVIVFVSWPSKKTREDWCEMEWRERLKSIWQLPAAIAIFVFVIAPFGLIAMYTLLASLETFINLSVQYLDLLFHRPLDLWKLVTGQCPTPYECP